jgi:hypothetical protein
MAAATWTDPVDRSDGYVVGGTVWNQLLGDTGDLQFLYENSWIPVAVNTSAQTTTSTSAVDLLTLTPTNSIGINDWAIVLFEARKTATAAQRISFGLKINSTTVLEAGAASGHTRPVSSATNQAEAGYVKFIIPPRSTANYGFGIMSDWAFFTTGGNITDSMYSQLAGAAGATAAAAAVPNAAITSVTIRAINNTSNNNAEVKNAALYVLRNQ